MLDTVQASKPTEHQGREPSRPMRILIIDDNELDRQRLIRLCDQSGLSFETTEVESLVQFGAALDGASFDLIFIDYFLAGDTGLDALEILSQNQNQTGAAAIMLAGEGQIAIAVEAMRRGCSDYMTKAMMNVDTLQKSIATALERRLMSTAMNDERSNREEVENSIRAYANACTAEMRSILSATLRRVRKLRTYQADGNIDYSIDLTSLEADIDRLWDALPEFKSHPKLETEDGQAQFSETRH